MLDLNLPYFWSHGRVTFTLWFVPLGLAIRHPILRRWTNTSLRSSIAANVAMGLSSWFLVVGLPVAIIAEQLAHVLILDRIPTGRADPYSWILALCLSALIAPAAELLALQTLFRQRLPASAKELLLLGAFFCVAVAAYAAARYVWGHTQNLLI